MSKLTEKQIEELIIKTMIKELPKMLGRSLVQIKEYLIKSIT